MASRLNPPRRGNDSVEGERQLDGRAFGLPGRRIGLVERPRLVASLCGPERPFMVIVSAPAGCGKSILLSQWAEADARPAIWIDLMPEHDDPIALIEAIVTAVGEVASIDPAVTRAFGSASPPVTTRILPRLGRALRALDDQLLVVLDDAHVLTSPRSLDVLQLVAENLPDGCTLAIGTRADPPIRRVALHSRGALERIDASDLAMNEHEARQLFSASGIDPSAVPVDEIQRTTEGWPAGLYLAVLAARERWSDDAVAPFAGDHHLVVEYVRNEILKPRSPEEVAFLRDTSVLERLTAELCDELRGTSDAGRTLRELASDNLLIVPLDPQHESYRYHILFAEALRAELWAQDPERMRALHRRASEWCTARAQGREAVLHALAAGDRRAAAALVWRLFPAYQPRGRAGTLAQWLELFTPEEQSSDPHLALTHAWINVETRSDLVAHWVATAAAAHHDGPLADGSPLEAALAILRATMARDGVEQVGRDASIAYRRFPQDSPFRSLCCFFQGVSEQLCGDPATARRAFEEGFARSLPSIPTVSSVISAWLGFTAVLEEDWDAVASEVARTRAIVQEAGLEEYGSMALGYAVGALHDARAKRAARARAELIHSRLLLTRIGGVGPFYTLAVRLVLAKAALLLGDPASATALAEECGESVEFVTDAPALLRELDATRATVAQLPQTALAGPGTLTSAELRVLQFLPTHLTYREIGERLFVSRFTVKSQAMSIYRKLGVHSRSTAVERGVDLGLIEA